MARIVIVSGLQVFPTQSGGQLRTAMVVRRMELENEVFLYSYTGRKSDYLDRVGSGGNQVAPRVQEFVNRSGFFGSVQWVFYRLGLPPLWLSVVSYFYVPKRLREAIAISNEVIVDQPFLFPILYRVKGKRVLNTHNVEHHLWRSSWFAKVFISPLVKWIEVKALAASEKAYCCSQEEKEIFLQMAKRPVEIEIIPNGVPAIQRDASRGALIRKELEIPVDSKVILFSASQYAPNRAALVFLSEFAREKRALLERLNVFLLVVGSVSPQARREGRLIVTGPVDEVAPYFSAADLAINPVNTGSGTNVKMYEYRAAGLPILSTRFGARGLGMVEAVDFVPFEDRESLAGALEKL